MTTELQRAMARYEDARIAYKKAVLASLNERSRGDGIRTAIREFQQANSDLRRLTGRQPRPRAVTPAPRPVVAANPAHGAFAAVGFFRRLLNAG